MVRPAGRVSPAVLCAAALAAAPARAEVRPLTPGGGDPRVQSAAFRSTVFATGLHYPYGMALLPDGSLLVGTTRPDIGGSYWSGTGELLRLLDADQDGHADGPGEVLFTGLPPAVTSVRRAPPFLLVTTSRADAARISVLREGPEVSSPYTFAGALEIAFPPDWEHTTYALAVWPRPRLGGYRVFFNVGSSGNASQSDVPLALRGLLSGELRGASVYSVVLQDQPGAGAAVSRLRLVAYGLRNAAGLAVRPGTRRLFLQDNGIDDEAAAREEPLSADEINVLRLGTRAADFGFPHSYVAYRTGEVVGGSGRAPLLALQPAAETASESEGAAEIAFAPPAFPPGLREGLFVGFHGRFSSAGAANEENPVVYVDPAARTYFHFVANDEPFVGHLDGLLSTTDSLFLSDMSSAGTLGAGGAGTGVVYQIRARPQ